MADVQIEIEVIRNAVREIQASNAALEELVRTQIEGEKATTAAARATEKAAKDILQLGRARNEETDASRRALKAQKDEEVQLRRLLIEKNKVVLASTRAATAEQREILASQKLQKQHRDEARLLEEVRRRKQALNQESGRLTGGMGNLFSATNLVRGAMLALGFALVRVVKDSVSLGFSLGNTLETARIGIAAVIKATDQTGAFDNFNNALDEAGRAIENIKRLAPETTATVDDLIQGFQTIVGPATAAGISIDETAGLTLLLSQATTALGIPTRELSQETRALINGNIDRNARLAQTLQITAEQIKQAKEEGRLLEFLTGRLKSFAEAGKLAQNTLPGLVSNLKDATSIALADALEPTREVLKDILKGAIDAFKDPDVIQTLKGFGENLKLSLQFAQKIGEVFGTYAALLTKPTQLLGAIVERYEAILALSQAETDVQINQVELANTLLRTVNEREKLGQFNADEAEFYRFQITTARQITDEIEKQKALRAAAIAIANNRGELSPETVAKEAADEKRKAEASLSDEERSALKQIETERAILQIDGEIEALEQRREAGLVETRKYYDELIQLTNDRLNKEKELVVASATATAAEKNAAELEGERISFEQVKANNALLNKLKDEEAKDDAERVKAQIESIRELNGKEKDAQAELRLELLRIESLLQSGYLTEKQARELSITAQAEYIQKLKETREQLQLLREEFGGGPDGVNPEVDRELEDSLRSNESSTLSAGRGVRGADGEEKSPFEQGTDRFLDGLTGIQDEAELTAEILESTLGAAIDGISDAIYGLITGTATWGDVFTQVGLQIVKSLIRIGVELIAQMILSAVFGKVTQATAASATATAMAGIATAAAPAAALVTVATFGGAIGSLAGLIPAVVATSGSLAALGASFAAAGGGAQGFEEGGLVEGGERIIRINEKGPEYVIPNDVLRQYGVAHFEAYRTGAYAGAYQDGGGVTRTGSRSTIAGLNASDIASTPSAGPGGGSMTVAFINSRQDKRDFQEKYGNRQTVDFLAERGNEVFD